ncbi:MAG: hypothetical protein HFE66_08185 [Clostridiales bacterium]|nr:hypothetical protein [Clostridiales bacterium]
MTDETLKMIRHDFMLGTSYKNLADKYGIPVSILQKIGRKDGWYHARQTKRQYPPDSSLPKQDEGNGMRLRVAVDTIAEIIDKMAAEMKGALESGDRTDIRQLKELTLAAKELAAVIRGLEEANTEDCDTAINVVLEGDIEKWAK